MINGKEETITAETTLKRFLNKRYGETLKGIAVALNGSLAKRSEWESLVLQESDELEVLQAVAGG